MIRKYILASVTKFGDDPSIIEVYDRILWGILMYGGAHIKTLWFFKMLRDYYDTKLNLSPFDLKNEPIKQFDEDLLRSSNALPIVEQIYYLKENIKAVDMWDQRHGSSFLIPQILVDVDDNNFGKAILMDEFFDENNPYGNNKGFVIGTAQRASRKLRGHMKLHQKIVRFQLDKSSEWIYLWTKAYCDHQSHDVPLPIQQFLGLCAE
ncbi:Ady4p ASCRUDRAFT_78435 [Ascoidea rubescens DSM 1968]|uniref:Uncharacterized protein n=1 Tax=Ascoidea rubescens DSM 1968 TaxID=1344418 RepID=A0A1D2VNT6_9ASCO|nr:hypothetical protein ASCRUDRAFT_78435 [Ascoidea rubescens DSM 1968]ODV63281.1 hypothetical protein ASCRUDRAFT_78435 [Ascoidea rubescens DSM 1968]